MDMDIVNHSVATLPAVEISQTVKDGSGLDQLAGREQERLRWAEQSLRLPTVWRRTRGRDIRVAVLDTGVDADHPDLRNAIVATSDFTGDGIEDRNGHGTHCAGIIGARANGIGFIGAAPETQLMIAKVLGDNGSGTLEMVADGVDWAVDQGADIISMSLGGRVGSDRLYRAIHQALAKGLVVICAAGNEGALFTNSIGYPGRYGGVITVAAHDRNGLPSGFSSRGGEVDFMGPGQDIWSTYKNGGYAKLSGTSMATPFVSAVAALVLSKHRNTFNSRTPIENNADLREHLMRMAAHPGHHDNVRGYGPLLPFAYFAN